jgi:hypothetical protein
VVIGASKELRKHPRAIEVVRYFGQQGWMVNIVKSEAEAYLEQLDKDN